MVIKAKPFGLDIVKTSLTEKEKEELDKTLPELVDRDIIEVVDNEHAIMVNGKQKDLYRLLLAISYHFDIELL